MLPRSHGLPGSKTADQRLTLCEFLACLVRMAFLRANPTLGEQAEADDTARAAERLAAERLKRRANAITTGSSPPVTASTAPPTTFATLYELPGCLKQMLEVSVLPHAKRDTSYTFRERLEEDADALAALEEHSDQVW